MFDNLFSALDGMLQILLLTLTEFVRMFNSLLKACDLGARFVKARLDLIESIRTLTLRRSQLLDISFDFPLLRNLSFERGLLLG